MRRKKLENIEKLTLNKETMQLSNLVLWFMLAQQGNLLVWSTLDVQDSGRCRDTFLLSSRHLPVLPV